MAGLSCRCGNLLHQDQDEYQLLDNDFLLSDILDPNRAETSKDGRALVSDQTEPWVRAGPPERRAVWECTRCGRLWVEVAIGGPFVSYAREEPDSG